LTKVTLFVFHSIGLPQNIPFNHRFPTPLGPWQPSVQHLDVNTSRFQFQQPSGAPAGHLLPPNSRSLQPSHQLPMLPQFPSDLWRQRDPLAVTDPRLLADPRMHSELENIRRHFHEEKERLEREHERMCHLLEYEEHVKLQNYLTVGSMSLFYLFACM